MATLLERLVVAVEGRTAEYDKALKGAEKRTKRFGSVVKKVAGTVAGLFAARAIIRGAADSVRAFGVQEQAVSDLNAALQATGKFSREASEAIQRSAAELQQLTTKGDEAIIAATASLAVLATELDAPGLQEAQKAIIGIADVFLKGDVEGAALLLGKSIGSTTNALTRYGIQIDTSATQSEKLSQILEQSHKFFDISKSRADTTKGSFEQLDNAIGDAKESLGELIIEMASGEGGIDALRGRVEQLNVAIINTGRLVPNLAEVFFGFTGEFGKSAERVVRLEEELGRARAAVEAFNLDVELGAKLTERQTNNWIAAGLSVIALEKQLKIAEDTLDAYTNRSFDAVDATNLLTNAIDNLGDTAPDVLPPVPDLIDEIGDAAGDAADDTEAAAERVGSAWEDAMFRSENVFSGFFEDFLNREENVFKNFTDNVLRAWNRMLAEMAARAVATRLFSSFVGAAAGGGGGILPGAPVPAGGLNASRMPTVINSTVNLNVSALDGPSVAAMLQNQKGTIVSLVREGIQDAGSFHGALL